MKHLFFLFALVFICLMGCKKDYPVSSNETPVFYFNGTVNGTPVNVNAGVNNYFMYSSYAQDSNYVYNFLGELKQTNCTDCRNKIKFQINNYTTSSLNGPVQIDTSLIPSYYSMHGAYSVLVGSATEYEVSFNQVGDSAAISGYTWDFGDGITETGSFNPTHLYTHPGYYNACLTITDSLGCSSSICKQIKVAVPDAECDISIIDSSPSGNTFTFSSSGSGTPNTCLWDFGDNTTSGSSTVTHTYLNPGTYKVSLQTIDNGNCLSNTCKNVSTQGFTGCLANFNFSVLTNQYPNPLSLSNVTITWTDNSGITYSSNTITQPNDSFFQIISVENYLNNENNQPTKKLHVKLKCTLTDGINTIQITDGDAVIAVSY